MLSDVNENELAELYAWVDTIPLSRPKKAIARDFADAVATAEVVHHYFPRMVELHNYRQALSTIQLPSFLSPVYILLGLRLPPPPLPSQSYQQFHPKGK